LRLLLEENLKLDPGTSGQSQHFRSDSFERKRLKQRSILAKEFTFPSGDNDEFDVAFTG
jgi:hypothetical protein